MRKHENFFCIRFRCFAYAQHDKRERQHDKGKGNAEVFLIDFKGY